MKSLLLAWLAALCLLHPLCGAEIPGGPETPPHAESAITPSATSPKTPQKLPGVDLAQGISLITGTAISPLLGVSAAGAWRYYRTPTEQRGQLPWYCHPPFWTAGFGVLGLCLCKDVFGAAGPAILKKPLDMAELFESKLSALVASAAFVPLISSQMAQHFEATHEHAAASVPVACASLLPLASFPFDYRLLFIPLGVICFLLVWLAGHAINVLIAVSPFTFVDTCLKTLKAGLLGLVAASYAIHPALGAAVCLLMIGVAAWMMPAALRLTVFGTFFALDTILPWRGKRHARSESAHAFLARGLPGAPVRTYGRLVRQNDGAVHFSYRPWFVLGRRSIALPPGSLAVARGLYFPSLLHAPEPEGKFRGVVVFLPRYRGHVDEIARHLGIEHIHESPAAKGLKAAKAWLSDVTRSLKRPRLEGPPA